MRLQIDLRRLQNYLRPHVPELAGGAQGGMKASQFNTGTSNPTYLLWNDRKPATRYVLRRKPTKILIVGAHQIDREYRVQKALENTPVPVAKMYHYCADESIVGAEFYIMECVPGRVIQDGAASLSPADRNELFSDIGRVIADLHSVDFREVGLEGSEKWAQ